MKSKLILSLFLFVFISGLLCQIPTKGLVLYLPLNGNARDSSSLANNGTSVYTTAVNDRFGRAGKALSFNGSSSYLRIPASKSLDLIYNKSISCWVFLPSSATVNNYSSIIFKDEPVNQATYSMQLQQEAGYGVNRYKFGYMFSSSLTNYGVSSKQLYTNYKDQWIHLVNTYDSISGYTKMYFNGIISDSTYIGNKSSNPSNLDLFIGRAKSDSYLSQTYFNGSLDDIRLYNRALSPKEVLALFNEGKPVTSSDTITYYVGSVEFKNLSPVSHLLKTETLASKSLGVDSIVSHFAKFEYKASAIQSISVTDTLVIKLNISGIPTVVTNNIVKIYPNPAKDHLSVDFGDYAKMQGYMIMIRDQSGKLVNLTPVQQKICNLDLTTWSGKGIYLIQILDSQSKLIDTKKIILQ